MARSIKIKLIKETKSRMTIFLVGLNRKMTVAKPDYEERIASGLYELVDPPQVPQPEDEEVKE